MDRDLILCVRGLLGSGRLGLAAGDRDAVVVLARCIIIIIFFLGRSLLRRCFLFFFQSHDWLATVSDKVCQLVSKMFVPSATSRLQCVHWLILLIKEGVGEACRI